MRRAMVRLRRSMASCVFTATILPSVKGTECERLERAPPPRSPTPNKCGVRLLRRDIIPALLHSGDTAMQARPFSRLVVLMLGALLEISTLRAQDFKKQVIYQIVTDRFYNGSTSNDNPSQSSGLFDSTQANWHLYWGGDLAGIKAKVSYLSGMGVTAIWISPPVDNLNLNIPDGSGNAQAPYHGYAARDFKRIEEHFGDTSNTWSAFDALVSAAHTAGIKVIVDFAPNHSNDNNAGEYASPYEDGTFLAAYNNDPNGYSPLKPTIHHHTNPSHPPYHH